MKTSLYNPTITILVQQTFDSVLFMIFLTSTMCYLVGWKGKCSKCYWIKKQIEPFFALASQPIPCGVERWKKHEMNVQISHWLLVNQYIGSSIFTFW